MSNSNLVTHTILSPHNSGKRNHSIDTITIHHMAGNLTAESCGNWFANPSSKASSNYGIDAKGRIGLYVDESNRSWATSSSSNDNRAITIEVADVFENGMWRCSDTAYNALIELCADICKRNGMPELRWSGDSSLIGDTSKQNMTVHRWFASTDCPGDYLYNKMGDIAIAVNKKLKGSGIVTLDEALNKLKDKGVIDTPEYWKNAAGCVNYLKELLIKVANFI